MSTIQGNKITSDNTRFFGMFLSRSSAGKSLASKSFPKPLLYLDSDLRKGQFSDRANAISSPEGITVETLPPLTTTWKTVQDRLEALWSLYSTRQRPYETIVVSSITTLVRIFMTDSVETRNKPSEFTLSCPVDYKFEGQVAQTVFDYLRSMPCNVIVEGHLVKIWGKDPGAKDRQGNPLEYAPDIIVGEELSLRHRLGENLLIYFDEVYKFSKSNDGKKHTVEFVSDIARTMYNFPSGPQDITNKEFYPWWKELIEKTKKPAAQTVTK